MIKFEYKVIRESISQITKEPALNELGNLGFELIAHRTLYGVYPSYPDSNLLPSYEEFIFMRKVSELE